MILKYRFEDIQAKLKKKKKYDAKIINLMLQLSLGL